MFILVRRVMVSAAELLDEQFSTTSGGEAPTSADPADAEPIIVADEAAAAPPAPEPIAAVTTGASSTASSSSVKYTELQRALRSACAPSRVNSQSGADGSPRAQAPAVLQRLVAASPPAARLFTKERIMRRRGGEEPARLPARRWRPRQCR